EEACTRQLEENNEHKLNSIMNKGDEDVKNRILIVRDLPLDMNKETLTKILEKHTKTKVTSITSRVTGVTSITSRVTGPWITANVIFDEQQAIKNIERSWSIAYLKDLCRIAPASFTKEDYEQRNLYTLKLTNLPFGITAYDLRDLLE